jgi:hypothetical protein
MPSKHTVVVSLDAETEQIVNELGGNRSQWIRDAIKWRHGPGGELETMEALAEARKRQVKKAENLLSKLVWCVETFCESPLDKHTTASLLAAKNWLELR